MAWLTIDVVGKPRSAHAMAGASSRSRRQVPKRSSSIAHARTQPGTLTVGAPTMGSRSRPRRRSSSSDAREPERPAPLRKCTRRAAAS